MLNFALKGTFQDSTGASWDYYRDDQLDPDPDPNTFYIIPRPQFALDDTGRPQLQILKRETSDPATDGSGSVHFDVELSVPENLRQAIAAQILGNPTKFPGVTAPRFATLAINSGAKARTTIGGVDYIARASSFGSNVASFNLADLTPPQMTEVVAALSGGGSSFEIEYDLTVPARLRGVSATLSFDSSIAYSYQVHNATFDSWGRETSPRTVDTLLRESASSTTKIVPGAAALPPEMMTDVTNWANATLADLVTAEVQKVMQIRGISSNDSFTINEVSSFTNNYSEDMVIDWHIYPKAALPTFASMRLTADALTATANERKQVMTVIADVPFDAERKDEAVVANVNVVVSYPGLQEALATANLTRGKVAHTFEAPFDEQHGSGWSFSYTVTYTDPAMAPVRGTITPDSGSYALQVEDAGTLRVKFDAQQAFEPQQGSPPPPVPSEITVCFNYVDGGLGAPITQTLMLTPEKAVQTITSQIPKPVDSKYNYQVTYHFQGLADYAAPAVNGENGALQIIPAPSALHPVKLIYLPKQSADNPIITGTVEMWYQQPPDTPPGSVRQPTRESPATFSFEPSDGKPVFETFFGMVNGNQPLVYSASLITQNGEVDIPETVIVNTQPSILVSPTDRYYTLEIKPVTVDWSQGFSEVEALVTVHVQTPDAAAPRTQSSNTTWTPERADSHFLTWPVKDGAVVTYDWEVNFVTTAKGANSVRGQGATDPIFNLPPHP